MTSPSPLVWLIELGEGLKYPATEKEIADGAAAEGCKVTPLIPAQALSDMQAELEERDATIREQCSQLSAFEMCADDMQARLAELANKFDRQAGVSSSPAACMSRRCANELRTLLSRDATTTEEPGEGG